MEVGTYIEHSVDHELSANIIYLCPVGALNNKPFRYHARRVGNAAAAAGVAASMRSATNLYALYCAARSCACAGVRNEEINETWITDRDRFGFRGSTLRSASLNR